MVRRLTRILILACLCLALTATAAQARPAPSQHRDSGFNTTPTSQTTQQRPVNLVVTSTDSFSYQDAAIGAAVVVGLTGIFVMAARRPRTRLAG